MVVFVVGNTDRCRLRRKSWKNPSRIYADNSAALEDGIGTHFSLAYGDLIFEVLDGKFFIVLTAQQVPSVL